MMSRIYSLFALLILFSAQLLAYDPNIVNVHINSGDPRFPFPQFLDYKNGKTLGRDNAIGVTDIEMEKTTREAYQIMMNRAVYTGTVVSGTKYITFNPIGHGFTGPEPDCSEGDGYALLASAYMADKPTFDGIYMYVHDAKGSAVELFSKCGTIRNPTYAYGKGTIGWRIGTAAGDNDAAADGDFDIALALMVAYRQWPTEGITDECGKKHTYKDLFISYLKTISDTVFFNVNDGHTDRSLPYCSPGSDGWYSGDIGFDGYVKSGNTWVDASGSGKGHTWGSYTFCSRASGQQSKWVDYIAPSYFKAFADFLETEDPVKYAWNIYQFRRAEASSDWIMGQINAQGKYPTAGTMQINGTSVMFSDANPAEDSRNPWRTILNYVWHGDPASTWDPVAQEIIPNKPNSFERNNAVKLASLANGWKTSRCMKLGNDPTDLMFGGVATIGTDINTADGLMNGGVGFHINWNLGSGAAAITANHFINNNEESKLLLAHWYRQLELMWDATDEKLPFPDNRYINSLPKYFHGWFRVLGLLVTTGNLQSPNFMGQPISANLKVYHAVNKTLAFAPTVINGIQRTSGDLITHTISYRNFATVAANGVSISYDLPAEVEFVSASNGGSVSGNKVVWNIGTVPGYKSTGETGKDWKTFDPTKYNTYGQVTLTVRVKAGANNIMICNQPTITATNSASFTSNEYPNNATPTMERNCVDIRARSLEIVKRSNRSAANDGDIINFTVEFQNSTKVGWLNGGRPDVRMTYGNGSPGDYTVTSYFRLLHGAQEAHINTGNYRVSYFINDAARLGLLSATNPNGWFMQTTILEGGDPKKVKFSSQQYTFGEDAIGKWNQRLIMQFADTLMPTTQHSNMFFASKGEPNEVMFVHKGIAAPFRMAVQMEARGAAGSGCGSMPIKDMLTDDWSYSTAVNVGMNDKSLFTPITPGWFDPQSTYDESLKIPIKEVHVEACSPIPTSSFDRVLVEEWDGYVWRRILGNGPVPGREIQNVCIRDTLPKNIVFQGFINADALGITAKLVESGGYQIIEWCAPSLLPGANGRISYSALAKTDCSADINVKNKAWIYSDSDSPIDSTVNVLITCKDLPPLAPNKSSIYKTADKKVYKVDEEVTYNIAFKQSDGTIAEPAMTSTADWKAICGTTMPANFIGMKQSSIIYEYSHGTNGELRAIVEPKIEMPFSLFFRNDGSTCNSGLRLEMKVNSCAQLTLDLYQSGTLLTSRTNLAVASPATKLNIHIKLEGSKLYLWVNNDNALPYVLDGITYTKPGYVGFQSPSTEQHTLSYWYTNFDSGFDVSLKDYLPSEIDFIAASQTVLFDQKGLYTKPITYDATTRTVNWTLATGKTPMLFGDSVSFKFKAKVATCGPGFIANSVFANLRGVPTNFYGAQSLVTCNKNCVPPTSVKITSDKQPVCPGEKATLTATADPTGTWVYKISGTATPAYSATNTFPVGKGTYTITAADATDPASCFLESAPITISEIADPSVKISSASSICIGTPGNIPLAVTPTGTAGTWKFDGTAGTSFASAGLAAGAHELIFAADAQGCPFADTIAFTVVETPEPTAKGPYSVLFGTANPLMEIVAETGATAGWFATASNYPGTPLVSTLTYTSTETAVNKYTYYIGQKKDGCWSKSVAVPFEITSCPLGAPTVPTSSVCMVKGKATLDVSKVQINLAGADSYKWYDQWGSLVTSDQVYSAAGNERYFVKAWSDQFQCYSPGGTAIVIINADPVASISLGTTACYLGATPIGALPATGGTWAIQLDGAAFSKSDIDPVRDGLAANQQHDLAWEYTDAAGCKLAGKQLFDAALPAMPAAKNIIANEQSLPHAAITATGAGDITWFSDACVTSIGTGKNLGMQFTQTTDLWLNQSVSGCKSECAKMTVTIDKCGVKAPDVLKADQRICAGDALPQFTVNAAAGLAYTWTSSAGTTSGASYQIQGIAAGTYTATVTASDGTCTSAGTPVSLIIEDLPVPTIVAKASICSGESSTAQFNPAPLATSAFTIDGSATATGTDLSLLSAGTHALAYTYLSAAGCPGTATASVAVVHTASPATGSLVEIISETPKGKLDAKESVNWYGPSDKTKFITSALSYTHPDVSKPGTWDYYITRTADGCESAPAVFTYQITNCRMPAPVITAPDEICAGSDITLTATKVDTASKVSWYTSAGAFIADGLTHSITAPATGTHTYIATQTGTCEGAREQFEFTVTSLVAPTISQPASVEICKGEPAPAFYSNGAGIGVHTSWYAGSGATGTLQNSGSALSVSTLQYATGANVYSTVSSRVLASGETCKSQAVDISFTVKPRPAAPQIAAPKKACYGEAPIAAGSPADVSSLHWYLDAKLINEISASAGIAYTPGVLFSATTAYAATEENGCLGAGTEVTFDVYDYIEIPVLQNYEACSNTAMPIITATNIKPIWTAQWQKNGTGAWSSEALTAGQENASYKMRFVGAGGCLSKESSFSYTYINPPVPVISVAPARLCLGDDVSAAVRVTAPGKYSGIETLYPGGLQNSTKPLFTVPAETIFAGDYTARTYSLMANGSKCWSTASAPATLEVMGNIEAPDSLSAEACEGLPLNIEATAKNTGDVLYLAQNSDGTGLIQPTNGNSYDVSGYTVVGTNTFYLWAVNVCPSLKVPVTATVHPAPIKPVISPKKILNGTELSICQGSKEIPSVIATSLGSDLEWRDSLGNPAGSGNGTAQLVAPAADQGASYRYTLRATTDQGCVAQNSYTYCVKPLPQPVIVAQSPSDTLCNLSQRTYTIGGYNGPNGYKWLDPEQELFSIEPGVNGDLSKVLVTPNSTAAGKTSLRLEQTVDGCAGTAEIEILIVPRADAAGYVTTDPMGGRALLFNTTPAISVGEIEIPQRFVWSFEGQRVPQGAESYLGGDATVWRAYPGDHSTWLAAYNGGGAACADSVRIDFYLAAITGLYPPTALSPRSSGSPVARWTPAGYGLAKYEVWVYDYWGNLVWYSNRLQDGSPAEGWDGRDANGNIVGGEIFTYRIRAEFTDGTKWKNSEGKEFGSIFLLK